MTCNQIAVEEHETVLVDIKGIFKGSTDWPSHVVYQGYSPRFGFIDVMAMGDRGGENYCLEDDERYQKGKTTWPDQHKLCALGLKVKCILDASDEHLCHAYGLFEQEGPVIAEFMRRVLMFQHDKVTMPEFPEITALMSEEHGMLFQYKYSRDDICMHAKDKTSSIFKEVSDELERLYKNDIETIVLSEKPSVSDDYMSQYPKLIDLKISLDEEVISNVDRIKGDWGLTSRGQTINGILRNLFEDDLED